MAESSDLRGVFVSDPRLSKIRQYPAVHPSRLPYLFYGRIAHAEHPVSFLFLRQMPTLPCERLRPPDARDPDAFDITVDTDVGEREQAQRERGGTAACNRREDRMDRLTTPRVALVVLLLAGSGADATTIRGVPSCAYWLQDREPGGGSSYFNAMWLVGYLSGAAVHGDKDILRTIDSESTAAWMDNYCKTNSSKNIAEGAEMLFDEIARRMPTDKASAASTAHNTSRPKPALAEPLPPAMPLPAPVKVPAEAPVKSGMTALPVPVKVTAEAPAKSGMTALPSPVNVIAEAPVESGMTAPLPSPVNMTAEVPAQPMPQGAEARAAAVNAPTYLPRALMIAHTLPLTNSKYQFKAEQFAKSNGCVRPAATMNIRTATSETFAVSCADGAAVSIRCDPECRDLQ
jgi:hypothetical protein